MKITSHNKTFEWRLRLVEWRYAQAALLGTALVIVIKILLILILIHLMISIGSSLAHIHTMLLQCKLQFGQINLNFKSWFVRHKFFRIQNSCNHWDYKLLASPVSVRVEVFGAIDMFWPPVAHLMGEVCWIIEYFMVSFQCTHYIKLKWIAKIWFCGWVLLQVAKKLGIYLNFLFSFSDDVHSYRDVRFATITNENVGQ